MITLDPPTILALSTLATSLTAAVVALVTLARQGTMKENIQKIEVATNSMKDQLVKATASASHAEGKAEGRAENLAEKAVGALAVKADKDRA